MSATLTPDEVRRVAALAHLSLTETEVETFGRQLQAILEWVDAIRSAETGGVAPLQHAQPVPVAGWRADIETPSLATGDVLDEAPDARRDPALYRVPSVL